MIYVDPRAGSGEVAPLLRAMHLPVTLEQLIAADFAFEGNTHMGLGMIGVERKKLPDLLQCITDGRLVGEQLPKLFDQYEFSYLVVEGVCRANPESGLLEEEITRGTSRPFWRPVRTGPRRFMWQDMDHFLTTLEHSRLKIRRTDNMTQTAYCLRSLYSWYRQKTWDQHRSLKALFSAPYPYIPLEDKTSVVRRVAKELTKIGPEKSLSAAMKFRTVVDMVMATEAEWCSIPGIGKGIARLVIDELNGRAEEKKV